MVKLHLYTVVAAFVVTMTILLGNQGVLPDYSVYLWPVLVILLFVIVIRHPIVAVCNWCRIFRDHK